MLLVLSGLGLTLFYNPTAAGAAPSLAYLHRDQPLGWLLHNTHRWAALLLFVFVILHALRVWLTCAYRYPRDINWWLGLGLLLAVIALGGTGYLLRWDIKAFALMDLMLVNLSNLPGLGPLLARMILGGSTADVVPIYRGYALHVWFLPMVLFLLITVHFFVVWKQGLAESPDVWRRIEARVSGRRWLHLAPGLALLVIMIALSAVTPHEGQAGPTERSVWPHPDWLLMFYFLPFWFFRGGMRVLGALVVPAGLLLFLALAPRLGRANARRVTVVGLVLVGVAGVLWLFGQTSAMGYRVPLQGCTACRRSTIIGGAPTQLSEFRIRDPDWLVFHLAEPKQSLLVPFLTPQ